MLDAQTISLDELLETRLLLEIPVILRGNPVADWKVRSPDEQVTREHLVYLRDLVSAVEQSAPAAQKSGVAGRPT
jgi:hypothetical protein